MTVSIRFWPEAGLHFIIQDSCKTIKTFNQLDTANSWVVGLWDVRWNVRIEHVTVLMHLPMGKVWRKLCGRFHHQVLRVTESSNLIDYLCLYNKEMRTKKSIYMEYHTWYHMYIFLQNTPCRSLNLIEIESILWYNISNDDSSPEISVQTIWVVHLKAGILLGIPRPHSSV